MPAGRRNKGRRIRAGGIRAGGIRAGGIRAGGIRAGGIRAGGIRAGGLGCALFSKFFGHRKHLKDLNELIPGIPNFLKLDNV